MAARGYAALAIAYIYQHR